MSVVRTTAKTPVKIQRDIYFSLTYERTKAQISNGDDGYFELEKPNGEER